MAKRRRTEWDEMRSAHREAMARHIAAMVRLDRIDEQLGELTNGWGKFVEALVTPGIGPALTRFGYVVQRVSRPGVSRNDGETMEVDAAVLAQVADGRPVVVATEIRSHLDRAGVQEWVETLPRFFEFYPEYADRELEGMVAGIRIDEGVDRLAMKEGFFVLASSGDAVRLVNPDGFRPRVWRRSG